MSWKCNTCGIEHDNIPLCFGIEAPWSDIVPENEFAQRVDLSPDVCVVDEEIFFVRGHIQIPIYDYPSPLAFSVWASLSEESFAHMCERWSSPRRASEPPYFGWLSSPISVYPDTLNLKLSVRSRPPGQTPLFTVELSGHPLALDQHSGITIEQWHEFAHQLLHS